MKGLASAIVLIFLSACVHSSVAVSPPGTHVTHVCPQKPVHITIVGDSLAKGQGARRPQNSLAGRIYTFIRKRRPGTTIRNLGALGATTEEVAARQAGLVRSDPCSLIVVIAGGNDVQKWYTPAHISAGYAKLLQEIRTRDRNGAIIAIGLPNVALSERIPWYFKPIESMLSKSANASMGWAAQQYGAGFVPLYSLSLKSAGRTRTLLSSDGIHPNDEGYELMAQAVYPTIVTLLSDSRASSLRR